MLHEVTRTMETPLLTHLDRIDAIEIFNQEHRPALNDGEIHILINWQDALKYTLDTETKTLYLLSRDNKADDEYNKIVFDEMQAAYKIIDDELSIKLEKLDTWIKKAQDSYNNITESQPLMDIEKADKLMKKHNRFIANVIKEKEDLMIQKEENKQLATDAIQKKYPQKQHIIRTPVKFTYGADMKDLLTHPILSTVI